MGLRQEAGATNVGSWTKVETVFGLEFSFSQGGPGEEFMFHLNIGLCCRCTEKVQDFKMNKRFKARQSCLQ